MHQADLLVEGHLLFQQPGTLIRRQGGVHPRPGGRSLRGGIGAAGQQRHGHQTGETISHDHPPNRAPKVMPKVRGGASEAKLSLLVRLAWTAMLLSSRLRP